MTELLRLSDYRRMAGLREPTVRLSFLNEQDRSPFLEGRSYILSAYSKTGKSELMTRVVLGWGLEVLWVSEESERIWEDRSLKLVDYPDTMKIAHAMGMPLADIGRLVDEEEWDVLVIDTVKMLRIQDENDTAEVMNKLQPLLAKQQEADKIAILLHHTRKAGGSHGMAAAGSHAFTAAVDTVLEIDRHASGKNRRILRGEGRIEPVTSLIYELTDAGLFVVVGAEEDFTADGYQKALERVMGVEWQTTRELVEQCDPKPSNADKHLNALVDTGMVERDPSVAKKGATYRWRKVMWDDGGGTDGGPEG